MSTPAEAYKSWIVTTGRLLREGDPAPDSPRAARRRAAAIRERMREAFGIWPEEKAPLNPTTFGRIERDGYSLQNLTFQTRPGCLATATAYVPAAKGPFPAVLCVHGHWAGARRDPVVQSRCIGLAKLGFLALTLDAWGSGERGTRAGTNEYHGSLLGASLWPGGTPLNGMQLYDNIRAVDYLQSRPDVLPDRIGCTGASGGGNQTTTFSAFDPRIRCAVPVCSVGRYQDYLNTACCVDEVLLGGLTFAEEGDLLGMVAPGAVMVITATRDVYHFGPESAGVAVARARQWFAAHGSEEKLRHVLIESGHNYHQPMREAMYGWMSRWLKDAGDGSPIPEPSIQTEDVEVLRCFPPVERPRAVMTTLEWVQQRTRDLAAQQSVPEDPEACGRWVTTKAAATREFLALPDRGRATPELIPVQRDGGDPYELLHSEPGVQIPTATRTRGTPGGPLVLLLHPAGMSQALQSHLIGPISTGGVEVRAMELRGCGELTLPGQALGATNADHNVVEWGLWIGRPLLGQWVHDIRELIQARTAGGKSRRVVLVGWREAGLAALLASALEKQVAGVAAIELPVTFVTPTPPHNVRSVLFQPDLVLRLGDLPQVAALAAPRPLLVAHPAKLDGGSATAQEATDTFRWTAEFYARVGYSQRFSVDTAISAAGITGMIQAWTR